MVGSSWSRLAMGMFFAALSYTANAGSVCVSYWPWGACALWENTSELSDSSSSSERGYDRIYFKNTCSRNIQTAIHVRDMDNDWETKGWWTLSPGETVYVANTKNSIFYTFAETIEYPVNRLRWEGTDYSDSVNNQGDRVGFRKVRSDSDHYVDYTYSFSCDGVYRHKAIALAWNSNGAWATRIRNTLEEARRAALAECSNCSLSESQVDPRTPGCLALAKASQSGQLFASVASTDTEARNKALLSCRQTAGGCIIEGLSCNN